MRYAPVAVAIVVVMLAVMMLALPTASGQGSVSIQQATGTPPATTTAEVYLPLIRASYSGRPLPTPIPFTGIRYTGTTSSGGHFRMLVDSDLSEVVEIQIQTAAHCENLIISISARLVGPLPIENRRFSYGRFAGYNKWGLPVYDRLHGEFKPDFSAASGDFSLWSRTFNCMFSGTWEAERQ